MLFSAGDETVLTDHSWQIKYTPDDGDLIELFYVPALEDAERYDRLTGYFNAGALALAARGIEGLVRNRGRMRLLVGCTLEPPEIEAIERGESLRAQVEKRLTERDLAPPDSTAADALELLAWMVGRGHLDVRVAVPCGPNGKPVHDQAIFHEKAGIVEDRAGNRIAWNGSLNETAAGWQRNWESINVYRSWTPDVERVDSEDRNFARLWANRSGRVIVLDVPEAVRRDLMRFMPASDLPARLKTPDGDHAKPGPDKETPGATPLEEQVGEPPTEPRRRVWSFIEQAPSLPDGGERVGEATSAIEPWPHQVRAFRRLYGDWPPKLLIADEVGLGKTIQAGMLLCQAWLSGRAKRILILAPKAILGQWQIELREKFNLNWPIYDGRKLAWYPSPALRGNHDRAVQANAWHEEPVVIASSQMMRRRDRAAELLDNAASWDVVVLDEAHHARRRAAGTAKEGRPNALLRLMQDLKDRSDGLILLTATPMQVHPIEVWDLLNLLWLPAEWTADAFLDFFDAVAHPNPSPVAFDRLARLFQAVETRYGRVEAADAARLTNLSRFKVRKVLGALRDQASIPRRQLETSERRAALGIVRANTPIRKLVSRHTRELLRRYYTDGHLSTPIADRDVHDEFQHLTPDERALYEAVEDYISDTYNQAGDSERNAVGFVMTVYRRRLASSFSALRQTLRKRLDAMDASPRVRLLEFDDDVPDDEAGDDLLDTDELEDLGREALAAEERADIERLLRRIERLPPDSKLAGLKTVLAALRSDGYSQTMVFTQYTDTMDFLREALLRDGEARLMCYSGRGGEIPSSDGRWRPITRDDAKRRFREGEADVLLCTEAAAEGLNFQFCGALVNYDMPWNPMRVEQRIGRIDRLGQKHATIRIVNLHYADTVETDVYRALRNRIGLFETVVGRLQPILSQLPRTISQTVLSGRERDARHRANVVDDIARHVEEARGSGFDIDAVTDDELIMPERAPSPMTMDDLDQVIGTPELMPPGVEVEPLGRREYAFLAPGMSEPLRVTTDPGYFEDHAESLELWSPGSVLFEAPELTAGSDDTAAEKSLEEVLSRLAERFPE